MRTCMKRFVKSCLCIVLLMLQTVVFFWGFIRLPPNCIGLSGIPLLVLFLATCLVLMIVTQFAFGVRRCAALLVRPIVALLLLVAIGFYMEMTRPSWLYVPLRFLEGEGFWLHRVGQSDAEIDGRRIRYEAYVDTCGSSSLSWRRGKVFLVARDSNSLPSRGGLLDNLILASNDMSVAVGFRMIHLPILPPAVICRGGISLRPHGKAQLFETLDITATNGCRRYECTFERWRAESTNFVCTVDEDFFVR